MARPSKKAVSKAQEASKALDRIFAEVDPNLILAGLLGGTATAGGVIPPFTRLMMTMGGSADDLNILFEAVKAGGYGYWGPGGILPGLFAIYSGYSSDGSSEPKKPEPGALFCSGALEAMLMYKAFSTPGLLEAVVKAPAEIIKGVGEIVPG
jgi:hypothetical protein